MSSPASAPIDPAEILHARILIVDDQESNITLLARILSGAGYDSVTSTTDPLHVRELHLENRYDLILLDLQMPGMDGFEVMESLKETQLDGYLPVLVITAQPGHKSHALQVGAKDFISKPFELAEVLARVHNMLEVRLLHTALHDQVDLLDQRVRERTAELEESYLEAIFAVTRAAEHKEDDIGPHIRRISYYTRALAEILGLDAEFGEKLFFASPMHDVGKIGIPDSVLLKPGGLTPEERTIMEQHSAIGATILGHSRSPYVQIGAEIALSHHERWDGGGYPGGIRGEAIPLTGRIMQICDIYDALRSKRPYKPAVDHVTTVDIITHGDGRTLPGHFDPAVLAAFAQNHEVFREVFERHSAEEAAGDFYHLPAGRGLGYASVVGQG
jgi:putative two-component system response regulator